MKARVKETGEIVEVSQRESEPVKVHRTCTVFSTADDRKFLDLSLEFLPNIDWEQRRYEIAKEAMGAFIASPNYQLWVDNNYYESQHTAPNFVAEDAVKYADALIKELKNEREHEL